MRLNRLFIRLNHSASFNYHNTTKSCLDCKFYIPYNKRCKKENNELAIIMRNDENKCGKEAKYFELNKFKMFVYQYYYTDQYYLLPLILVSSYLILNR